MAFFSGDWEGNMIDHSYKQLQEKKSNVDHLYVGSKLLYRNINTAKGWDQWL